MNITSALIVDDSKMARVTLKKHLESLDIKVYLAETGEESLEFLKSKRPDVIFMDCLMPGIDGFETTRLISSNPKTASIPVIMCTAKETDEDRHKAMDAGAFSYMMKSSSSGPLKDILADLDKFDAQMTRITSSSSETVDSVPPTLTETDSSKAPLSDNNSTVIDQTLSAVENVLNNRLNQITLDFNRLSKQFSIISTQLEDKIIYSVKSSITESHQYTDTQVEQFSDQLQSLRSDFDHFKTQVEAIDFDQLILETINTHLDQLLEKRRAELAEGIMSETSVQNLLDEKIHNKLKATHEKLTSLEQDLKQKLDKPSPKSPLYLGVAALLISLGTLAVSAFVMFR